ncbi:capping protein, Arp2/3 and myosin-I linker protein 3 [Brachionichthys hirsutus]|uniref:capping protein, Arp2/3 and myosin-I linker protein 3 n=1 Tax=Brachionichthys hirsutus TaxID=412623 RepID=UPI0036044B60
MWSFSVSELAIPGAEIGRISATDADLGDNAKLEYTILEGESGDTFNITGGEPGGRHHAQQDLPGRPARKTHLEDSPGRPARKTRLEDPPGRLARKTRPEDSPGRPARKTRLEDPPGRPARKTRLEDPPGRPAWKTRPEDPPLEDPPGRPAWKTRPEDPPGRLARKTRLEDPPLEDPPGRPAWKTRPEDPPLSAVRRRSVTWDRNSTTATGFQDVARALEHNFSLQYMPLPLSDVTQAYRSAPERTDHALTKIQRALLRNNQTQGFSQKQALRLHQGLVTSTAEQVMERLCVRVQQQLCVLKGFEEGEEVQTARQILKEARDSRALYPSLCELAHVLSVDGPVKQRLDALAGELAKAADKELQVVVDSMVSLCRELCPMSCSAAERLSPPLASVSEQVSVPRSAVRSALMERAAEDINRALEEVKLSVVSYLTNSIVDQILQELYATHKALVLLRQVSQVKRWDDGGSCRRTVRQSLEFPDEDANLGIDTMAVTKRSSRTRRIRPVSTRPSVGDEASPSPTPAAPPLPTPLTHSASWECLSTLPTNGSPLRHVTHVRPRPPRRHRAGHLPPESRCSENGAVDMLEDGLPDFYSKRVLPDSQLSSLHRSQSLRRKKRRSVLSIFSGFRRNRNSTVSNQDSDSALENVYSMIQHPKDAGRPEKESAVPGTNGAVPSPRPTQGVPGAASPSCLIQRQPTDLVSIVYSCIGAEVDDSDGSSGGDAQRSASIADSPAETASNGHVASPNQQTGRRAEAAPLMEEDGQSRGGSGAPCGLKPEPPPQSTKPSLAAMRQRHLQESLEEAGRLMGQEDQADGGHEDELRARGPGGRPPLIPSDPSLDPSRDGTSPGDGTASPEEPAGDQESSPAARPGNAEAAGPGKEGADPSIKGDDGPISVPVAVTASSQQVAAEAHLQPGSGVFVMKRL